MIRLATFAIALLAIPSAATAAPSFLEAAAFFLSGNEPQKPLPDNTRKVYAGPIQFALDDTDPCTIFQTSTQHLINLLQFPTDGNWPTNNTAFWYTTKIQFNQFPSPKAAQFRNPSVDPSVEVAPYFGFGLRADSKAACNADDLQQCARVIIVADMPNVSMYRRLQALQYIRDNYCPGLREPPPKPIKPY
jgi:hypothetical protein